MGYWHKINDQFLNHIPEWFYNEIWISDRYGNVFSGRYEWEQGHNPHRLKFEYGGDDAMNEYWVKPMLKPKPPMLV